MIARRPFLPSLLVAGVVLAAVAVSQGAEEPDPTLWPEAQRAFFQDGPALLLSEPRRQELQVASEAERQRLIEAFLSRDPIPETPANELAAGIERRKRLAAQEFLSPRDVRAQLLFLNGRPDERLLIDCGVAFVPIEIWTWGDPKAEPAPGVPPTGRVLVFQPGPEEGWRVWIPLDSKRALYTSEMEYWLEQWEELGGAGLLRARRFDLQTCGDEAKAVDAATGVRGLRDFQGDRPSREDYMRFLEPPPDLASWARVAAATELPEGPPELTVESVEMRFPERDGQRILARAILELPDDAGFAPDPEAEEPEIRLSAEGLIEQDGEIFDEFRVRFQLEPGGGEEDGVHFLAIDRPLRPGRRFVMRVVLTDEVSGAVARIARGFEVPTGPRASSGVEGDLGGQPLTLGEELARQRIPGIDSLVLVPPETDVVLGLWRAEALVTGESIQKVIFKLDGNPQLTRTRAPWTAELRLAEFPAEHVVRAEGYDADGELVAADEVVLNQPRGSFKVRIVEPTRGSQASGTITARAEVVVPEERRVEEVEFRLDNRLVTTLDKPPWEAEIDVPGTDEISYLAVAAVLDDGRRAEDIRFLNAPEYLERVDVNLVELYTAVTDRNGRLVTGLTRDDFQVFEDGRRQEITKFELVEDLPLTIGITIDTSGSMVESLAEARRAAVDFLDNVVERGDRSFAVAFSNQASLLMPPTDDVAAVEAVLENLQAVGWTALHDAIVTSLYYFRGFRGQKAMVLLSDGDDTASSLLFDRALEYARRSGVALYTVGLDVGKLDLSVRSKLKRLAEETGGRSFFISRAEELAGVYDVIEQELRSRYLIAYSSERPSADGEFREVEVQVEGKGLEARTIRGYYP